MANLGILKDFPIAGTDLRGLIIQGPFALCAYVGVPKDHWLAEMQSVRFKCHYGITFADYGDGELRPNDWFWYGWDYAHHCDQWVLPDDAAQELKDAMARFASLGLPGSKGKAWTVAEVECEVIDAALDLQEQLITARQKSEQALACLKEIR